MAKNKRKTHQPPLPWNAEFEQLYQKKLQLKRNLWRYNSKRDKSSKELLTAELKKVLKLLRKGNQTSKGAARRRRQYLDKLAVLSEEQLAHESSDPVVENRIETVFKTIEEQDGIDPAIEVQEVVLKKVEKQDVIDSKVEENLEEIIIEKIDQQNEIDMASEAGKDFLGSLNMERLVQFFVCKVEANPQFFPLIKDVIDALRVTHSKIEALELALMESKDEGRKPDASGERVLSPAMASDCIPKKLRDEVSVAGTGSDSDAAVLSTKKKKSLETVADSSFTSDAPTCQFNDSLTDVTESSLIGEGRKRKRRKSAVQSPAETSSPIPASVADQSQIMLNISSENNFPHQNKYKKACSENREDFSKSNISCLSSTPSVERNHKRLKHSSRGSSPCRSEDRSLNDRNFTSPQMTRSHTPKTLKRSRSLPRGIDCAEYELDSSDLDLNIQSTFPFTEREPKSPGSQVAESGSTKSSPLLRVIPSVLLLQNPENFEMPDIVSRGQEETPAMHETERTDAAGLEKAEENSDSLPHVHSPSLPWRVYFEFDGSVEDEKPVEDLNIRLAISDVVDDNEFEIFNIRRYRFTLAGSVRFAIFESALRLTKRGFSLNGKPARIVRGIRMSPPVRDETHGQRVLSSCWNSNIHRQRGGHASRPVVSHRYQNRRPFENRHPNQNRRNGRPDFRGSPQNRGNQRDLNHRSQYKWDRKAPRL